jgi:two-component system sensor histidine kinase KdpD
LGATITNVTTTAALALLVIILLVAAYGRLWMAMVTAVAAMLVFNFFFLPPVGRLAIAEPQHWVTFIAFISAALIVSQLSSAVERRAREAITSRNELELVRQKADFTSTLLASLSHDLRTPLTAIQVAITNLQNHALTDEARHEQVHVAEAELGRLSRLFTDILDIAKIDSASLSPEREWVTPSDVIDAALANLGTLLTGRSLKVEASEDILVNVDPRLTSAALSHLIENAAQYSPAASTIEISGSVGADALELTVTDHGSGIDPAELPQLFDRFYRGKRQQIRPAGTGMGLAITRGLLAVEQGRVSGENTPSGGARFSITIPAAQRPVEAEG